LWVQRCPSIRIAPVTGLASYTDDRFRLAGWSATALDIISSGQPDVLLQPELLVSSLPGRLPVLQSVQPWFCTGAEGDGARSSSHIAGRIHRLGNYMIHGNHTLHGNYMIHGNHTLHGNYIVPRTYSILLDDWLVFCERPRACQGRGRLFLVTAIGATTFWRWLQNRKGHPVPLRKMLDQSQQCRIRQPVVNETPLTPGSDNPRLAQGHELLRDVGLRHAQHLLQMANTGFALPDRQQDCQPGWVGNRLQNMGNLVEIFAVGHI